MSDKSHTQRPRPWLGRAVPIDQLLPPHVAAELRARGVEIIHPALGLAVAARLSSE